MTALPFRPERDAVRPAAIKNATNGKIPAANLKPCGIRSFVLVEPAARAMNALVKAAAADGVVISATGTYRTYDRQEALFLDRYTTKRLDGRPTRVWNGTTYWQKPGTAMAAVPGTSNHGWGLAVDFATVRNGQVVSLSSKELKWLAKNGPKFGWWNTVSSENWHWTYCLGDAVPKAVRDLDGEPAAAPASTKKAPPAGMGEAIAAARKKVLRRGDKGNDVFWLQVALNNHGAGLKVDRDFGPATERAVRKFQKDKGLTVDGVVGRQTWKALFD
jgi:hypothetical protein